MSPGWHLLCDIMRRSASGGGTFIRYKLQKGTGGHGNMWKVIDVARMKDVAMQQEEESTFLPVCVLAEFSLVAMHAVSAQTAIYFHLNLLFELNVVIKMLFLAHESGLSVLCGSSAPVLWLCSCALSHQGINGSFPESSHWSQAWVVVAER